MLTKQEILEYLKKNKDFFYDKYSIVKIGIFGSFARDEQTESSDIDILIEMPRETEDIFEKKQELRELIQKQFNRQTDICRERSIRPMFKPLILKEAIYA